VISGDGNPPSRDFSRRIMSHPPPLLEWLDRHPEINLWLTGGLIALGLAGVLRSLRRDQPDEAGRHDWAWGGLLFAILVAGRWPAALFPREFNPDESQLLAGAHTLTGDPVFWRSVNGGTAGPLDFYALWPAGWLGGWDSYLPARITADALLIAAFVLAHQCMTLALGRTAARAASLTTVCFTALTFAPDFLHYSTELVPVTLLAGAAYAATRRGVLAGSVGWNFLGGLLIGAVPLAKLQPVPLALVAGVGWLVAERRRAGADRSRRVAGLLIGAITPAFLGAIVLTVAGEWESFSTSYLQYNFAYAAAGSLPFGQALAETLANSVTWDSLLHFWLPGWLGWVVLMVRLRPSPNRTVRIFLWCALAACLLSLFGILSPRRSFLHYWQLFVIPANLLAGALVANLLGSAPPRWRQAERGLVAAGTLGLVGTLCLHRLAHPGPFVGNLVYAHEHPRTKLAQQLAVYTRPGDRLAVWGWSNHLYVETGLCQATRDAQVSALLEPGALQEKFRARYLADLARSQPALFIDTIGPASLNLQAPELRHEQNFPALAEMIRTRYDLVEDTENARIYRRKDLAGR
jgi:hypothetical protein